MLEPTGPPSLQPWLAFGLALTVAYRALMATLLQALHALPSLQRRRLLEEEAIPDARLEALLERPHVLALGVTLLNQLLLLLFVFYLWPLGANLPGGPWTLALGVFLYVWALDLLLPTLISAQDPAIWISRLFPFYAPVHLLLVPLVAPLGRFMARRREAHEKAREAEDEELGPDAVTALLEEGEAEGILEEEDRELIRNVVGFGDTVAREVMTPRTSIQAIDRQATREEVWAAFRAGRHSRLPVYDGQVDRVVGILLLKDLLQLDPAESFDPIALAKTPHFVPESKPIQDLLRDLQRARTQMAVVVDEFGSVSGLVTLEDLLEEVFGEIQEEHEGPADIQETEDGALLVAGHVHIEDLEARLGLAWEREGFDTLAGLVMARLGRVPASGESVCVEGARLTVLKVEGARIQQVRLEPTGETPR